MNVLREALQMLEDEDKAEVSKQVLHQQMGIPKNLAKDIVIRRVPEERRPIEEGSFDEPGEDDEDEVEWIE